MGYVESNLGPNETVRYRAEQHWVMFIPHVFGLIGIVALGGVIVATGANAELGDWTLFLLGLGAVANILVPVVDKATTEMAVTSKRLIVKTGVIKRRTLELRLEKLETLAIDQSILGRLLDYGTIRVVGTGGTMEAFPYVSVPLELRKAVNAATSLPPPPAT